MALMPRKPSLEGLGMAESCADDWVLHQGRAAAGGVPTRPCVRAHPVTPGSCGGACPGLGSAAMQGHVPSPIRLLWGLTVALVCF